MPAVNRIPYRASRLDASKGAELAAARSFRWKNDGADLHIIAGNAFEIGDVLQIVLDDDTVQDWSDFDHRPAGVSVAFTTGSVTFTLANQGVEVLRDDDPVVGQSGGRVTSNTPPAVRNFIVTATVTGTVTATLYIRVFLHDSLVAQSVQTPVRVSPGTLHIPAGHGARFSVLALFDDGSDGRGAGDITQVPLIDWAIVDNTTDVRVGNGRFTVVDQPANLNQAVQVEVTIPESLYPVGTAPDLPLRQFPATVTPVASWDRATPAEPVDGAQVQRTNDLPNWLFLPDGFSGDDGRAKFNKAVQLIVNRLRTHPSSRPFDLLLKSKALNLFKAWVPSFEAGATALSEVARNPQKDGGLRVPVPLLPPAGQTPRIRSLENLLWQVGLPTKAAVSRTFAAQKSAWIQFFGPIDTPDAQLNSLWTDWLTLYPRYLALEKDTAFGIAWGTRPQVSQTERQRGLRFNRDRTARDDFDPLLAQLFVPNQTGQPIGARWSPGGADRTRIVMLVNGPVGEGMRTSGSDAIAFSTLAPDNKLLLEGPLPDDGAILDSVPVPLLSDTISPRISARVAHEIGHGLNLGDEYSERGVVLPAVPAHVSEAWNLHTDTELITNNQLRGESIRWDIRWKRLSAAGVLATLPVRQQGGTITMDVQPGHGEVFKNFTTGAKLRFRRRPLLNNISPFESDQLGFQTRVGDRIEVTASAALDNYITFLQQTNASPDSVLLIAPRLDDAGNEMGLMHDQIRQQIVTTHSPLNRVSPAACNVNPINGSSVMSSPNVPAGLLPLPTQKRLPVRFLALVVGLYDGGSQYACGIYHPQATCLMRTTFPIDFEPLDGPLLFELEQGQTVMSTFCPVCRYILVDQLDPTQHGAIDDDYQVHYPRTS
jgi:hypothetical protein